MVIYLVNPEKLIWPLRPSIVHFTPLYGKSYSVHLITSISYTLLLKLDISYRVSYPGHIILGVSYLMSHSSWASQTRCHILGVSCVSNIGCISNWVTHSGHLILSVSSWVSHSRHLILGILYWVSHPGRLILGVTSWVSHTRFSSWASHIGCLILGFSSLVSHPGHLILGV